MQILLWALFLVIMWNWGGLTRGKTLRRRGLAHDNSANNGEKFGGMDICLYLQSK